MTRVMHTVGATVPVEWFSGPLSAATLAVTRPDGTLVSPAPTVSMTSGLQTASFLASIAGQYQLVWTIAGGLVQSDVVDVWPTTPRLLVSVADALHRISTAGPMAASNRSEYTQTISLYIAAATWQIESIVGPLLAAPRTFTLSGSERKRAINLPGKARAVTSVTVDGTLLTAGTDYKVDTLAAIVIGDALAVQGDLNVVIVYSEGDTSVPPPARLACLEIVAHMWQISRQGSREAPPGDETVTTPLGFAIPRRAWELLQAIPAQPGFA